MGTPNSEPASLLDLQKDQAAFVQARNWGRFHSPKNLACAVVVESAELLELFEWRGESESVPEDLVARVADEMADITLYLLSLSELLSIDLLSEVQRKLVENRGRWPEERHEGPWVSRKTQSGPTQASTP